MSAIRRAVVASASAFVARAVLRGIQQSSVASSLERTNHRGRTVSLAAGPALTVGVAAGAAAGAANLASGAAALTAGLGAGAVGLYDDVVGHRPEQRSAKGFRGHLAALKEGRVTSGLVKVAGIGVAGLVAAGLLESRRGGRVADVLISAGVIAGTANLVNLLDLRPGRAIKASMALASPLGGGSAGDLVTGPVAAASALLPDDLDEKVMLGDSGANALGAVLGVAAAARFGRGGRVAILAGLAALTLASEKVSFTKVIEATPGLRELDSLGRRRADS